MTEPYCPYCSHKTSIHKVDDSVTSPVTDVFECGNCRSRFPVSEWAEDRILREIR